MLDGIFVKQGMYIKIRLIPDWHPRALLPKQDDTQDGRQTCFSILKRHVSNLYCLLIALKWSYLLEN